VVGHDTLSGVDVLLGDLFGGFVSDFLDIHTAGGADNKSHAAGFAVEQNRSVQFFFDVACLLHQHTLDHAAFGPRLMRDKRFA
jgi:hypothetical protein